MPINVQIAPISPARAAQTKNSEGLDESGEPTDWSVKYWPIKANTALTIKKRTPSVKMAAAGGRLRRDVLGTGRCSGLYGMGSTFINKGYLCSS